MAIPSKTLINIDALFDTYLACVFDINQSWVLPLIKNGYKTRNHNTLSRFNPQINDDLIKDRYIHRDINIIRQSKQTNIVNLLANKISESNSDFDHPEAIDYKITINTYPYEFTKEELVFLFKTLKYVLQVKELKRVHIPIENITPQFLKEKYNTFIFYDIDEWLAHHRFLLRDCRMQFVKFIIPLCYREGMEDKEEYEEAQEAITDALKAFVELEFVPLSDMSIHVPAKE
jgi:hypothetical protein